MASPFAWGIDIGNRALKAVKLTQGPEGLQIDDFDVVEHEQVLSNAGDNRESLLQAALANFVQRHELKGAPVAIGVSGQNRFARFIKLPPVEPKKIPEIVRFEAIQQIPFPLQEVEWSYQLFQDDKSPDVEVGIFAMRRDLVNQHINHFTSTGLNVQVVQMNPLAVYNAMYYDQRLKGTTMIIDLGAENTDLIIAEGETIWLRSIPVGGNKFTEALANQFKLKFPKAEDLKRNAATSKYGRQILQAMKPVFNELVSEIQRSIGFYASVHRDSRITRVLALGGTFRLPGLQKYVQQNLQIEVHRIDRLGTASPSDAKVATVFSENILSSVSAYGLAIQAMNQAKINSSLLPQKIRKEKMWREKIPWFGAAAAVFVAAPVLAYASIYWADHSLEVSHQIDTQNRGILRQASELDKNWDTNVENAGDPDRKRAINYQALKQGRDTQNTLIGDITSALPIPAAALLSGDKTKMPPRDQREIIRIDRLAMDYHEDMSPYASLSDEAFRALQVGGLTAPANAGAARPGFGGGGGGFQPRGMIRPGFNMANANAAPGASKSRGFMIEIVCTTPKAGGASFVLDNFVSKLVAMKSSNPEVIYKVEKVQAPFSMRLGNDATMGGAGTGGFNPASSFNPAGGAGRGFGTTGFNPGGVGATGATATGTPDQPVFDPMKDPVTGEDMSNDTRVTIRMAITLDPGKAPAAGGMEPAPEENNTP
jgi:type IV pilus assembly protein PilM